MKRKCKLFRFDSFFRLDNWLCVRGNTEVSVLKAVIKTSFSIILLFSYLTSLFASIVIRHNEVVVFLVIAGG